MGGAAVLRAIAVNQLKPEAVVIESTFDRLLNAGKNRFRAMGLPGSPFAQLPLFGGSLQHRFNFFLHNPADYARAVDCPILVLQGESDKRVTVEQGRAITRSPGAKARLIVYAGVPHLPIAKARPENWKHDLKIFFEEVF